MKTKTFPGRLHEMSVLSRVVALWLGFMIVLWGIFAVALVTHPQGWINVGMVEPEVG